jgi:hypothetical protein
MLPEDVNYHDRTIRLEVPGSVRVISPTAVDFGSGEHQWLEAMTNAVRNGAGHVTARVTLARRV